MGKLVLFNLILIGIISLCLYFVKKYAKSEKTKYIVLLISAILTILVHYSSFIYTFITKGPAIEYLREYPNLILPIYPCNVVMWCALIFGIIRNKDSKIAKFLSDYLFWFGIFSTLVGMFANVDFINNPTLTDYEIVKSIVAHATLLFNVLLIFIFGYVKIDLNKNMLHIIISVIIMYIIGLYCNTLFSVLVSVDKAYSINSMFIIHSPFEAISFLTYPIIALCSLILYFALFAIIELFVYQKNERWFNRLKNRITNKNNGEGI